MSITVDMDLKEIGQRLYKIRKAIGKTLKEMEEMCGYKISNMSDFENGKRRPNVPYLFFLAKEFKANVTWILTGTGKMFVDFDMRWDFGVYNEIMKEMFTVIGKSSNVRTEMIMAYMNGRRRNQEEIETILGKKIEL